MTLTPLEPGKTFLTPATTGDSITYAIREGIDWIVVQLSSASAWPGGAVITAQVSLSNGTFSDFPAAAVTYTAVGVKEIITVTGVRMLRLIVTTTGGTTETIVPTLTAGADE